MEQARKSSYWKVVPDYAPDAREPMPRGKQYRKKLIEFDAIIQSWKGHAMAMDLFSQLKKRHDSWAHYSNPRNVREFILHDFETNNDDLRENALLRELELFFDLFVMSYDSIGNTFATRHIVLCNSNFLRTCCWVYMCLNIGLQMVEETPPRKIDRELLGRVRGVLVIVRNATEHTINDILAFPKVDFDTYFVAPPVMRSLDDEIRYCVSGDLMVFDAVFTPTTERRRADPVYAYVVSVSDEESFSDEEDGDSEEAVVVAEHHND